MVYHSLKEICLLAENENSSFWQIICQDDCMERQITQSQSFEMMLHMYEAMEKADRNYAPERKSPSRMAGGDGEKLKNYTETGKNLSGAFIGRVMEKAVKMAETNACMGRIVAAPTAGSCGVLPAVLLTYEEFFDCSREKMAQALYTAAGIGQIIAERASIAGASGGCQAEIGSASAMAAGALTFLQGGDGRRICDAVAISLKGLLGLTCDPVAGLVEVPCVKRNVIGAVNAVTSTDMVMAGVTSVIPADEVIDAMGEIGRDMPRKFKETSEGGLAVTPAAQAIEEQIRLSEEQI